MVKARTLVGVAVLVGLAAGGGYLLLREDPVPVTVYRVVRGRVEQTITNSKAGTVKTRRRATLSPEIGGRVAELAVREGDVVEKGRVLVRVVDEDLRAEVALRERGLASAAASRREACVVERQARREYERYLRLEQDDIVSRERLDALESERDVAEARCQAAQARVTEAEAAMELARVQLAKSVLRAPFDAVVAEVSTEVGEWVTPSPPGVPIPPVIELIDPAAIYVSAPLDEVDLARVETGRPVRITLDAYPEREFGGRVLRVAPYVLDLEEHSRTFEVEVGFDDADFASKLKPGASADVEVILDARDDVTRVPSYALIEGRRVLVVDSDTLVSREVETGLANWAFTEIRSGLEEGELVVVSLDRVEVREGARVRVTGETER